MEQGKLGTTLQDCGTASSSGTLLCLHYLYFCATNESILSIADALQFHQPLLRGDGILGVGTLSIFFLVALILR